MAVAICTAIPAVLAIRWFVKGTLDAGKGASTPSIAILDYFHDTPLGGPLSANNGPAVNLFCKGKAGQLHQQALQLAITAKRAEIPGRVAFDRVEEHPTAAVTTIDGDHATVRTKAQWQYTNTDPKRTAGSWLWWSSNYQPWTFRMVNQNGWRICEVTPPDPCTPDSAINCDPKPQPSPTPTTTRTWDLRVPYRCLPDRPYHDLAKDCATPPADWIQPGPYYCAPDQPFGIPTGRKDECAALGWT